MTVRNRKQIVGSIRWRFLAILLCGAVLPLAISGVWLGRSAVHAAENIARAQMKSTLALFVAKADERWDYRRGELLGLASNEVAARTLASPHVPPTRADSQFMDTAFASVDQYIERIRLRSADGAVIWAYGGNVDDLRSLDSLRNPAGPSVIRIKWSIDDFEGRSPAGEMEAEMLLGALLPLDSIPVLLPGAELSIVDLATGQTIRTGAHDLPHEERSWVNDRVGKKWLATWGEAAQAPLAFQIVLPAQDSVGPFTRAASAGFLVLVAVVLATSVAGNYLTLRVTRSLELLAVAADGVSAGELDQKVDALSGSPSEVVRLASAFNSMTTSLRRTMQELANRNALAAVGEFAASLSHEVRNGLSAVRLDLQRLAETEQPSGTNNELIARSLANVTRLSTIVTGALGVARGGHLMLEAVDLNAVLARSAAGAAGAFSNTNATLHVEVEQDVVAVVNGDAIALEQLFLNLLLNAGQALSAGDRAVAAITLKDDHAVVSISDTGPGMLHVYDPESPQHFTSSKRGGTGLGLSIATRIAAAHGGSLSIQRGPTGGTTALVRLPRVSTAR